MPLIRMCGCTVSRALFLTQIFRKRNLLLCARVGGRTWTLSPTAGTWRLGHLMKTLHCKQLIVQEQLDDTGSIDPGRICHPEESSTLTVRIGSQSTCNTPELFCLYARLPLVWSTVSVNSGPLLMLRCVWAVSARQSTAATSCQVRGIVDFWKHACYHDCDWLNFTRRPQEFLNLFFRPPQYSLHLGLSVEFIQMYKYSVPRCSCVVCGKLHMEITVA